MSHYYIFSPITINFKRTFTLEDIYVDSTLRVTSVMIEGSSGSSTFIPRVALILSEKVKLLSDNYILVYFIS
jgi:hypothetical protein